MPSLVAIQLPGYQSAGWGNNVGIDVATALDVTIKSRAPCLMGTGGVSFAGVWGGWDGAWPPTGEQA